MSILLVAAGAILAFAVNSNVQGVDIHTIGWIRLAVGLAGFLLSMIFWSSWAAGYFTRRTTYGGRRPRRTAAAQLLGHGPGTRDRPQPVPH